VGRSCLYRHIFTTAAKMTVFICHRDYFCPFFYFGSIIFSVPPVCRQRFIYIHIQPHYTTVNCIPTAKCVHILLIEGESIWTCSKSVRLSVRCREWGNDIYENTRVTEQVLKITHCPKQTKLLITSRTTEYEYMRTLLTPWSTVLLEKLTISQVVKKFPAFYGTPRFITAFANAGHVSLS